MKVNFSFPEVFKSGKFLSWLRKAGVAGFIFFLLKGIAWLVLGYLVLT